NFLRRRRSGGTIGVVGLPSLIQPLSTAISWQRRQTSTKSAPEPSGAYRTGVSPVSSERPQMAQMRVSTLLEICISAGTLDLGFLFLLLRLGDQLLRDVGRNFLVAQEMHVVVAASAGERGERLRVREDLRHRHLGLDLRHPAYGLHPLQAATTG